MRRRPTGPTLTYTRLPYTTLFRSALGSALATSASPPVLENGCTSDATIRMRRPAGLRGAFTAPPRAAVFMTFAAAPFFGAFGRFDPFRSEEHTSELQSLMRISYAVFCLKKKKT